MVKGTAADIGALLAYLVFAKSHPQAQPGDLPLHAGGLSNGFDICGLARRAGNFRFSGPQSKKMHPWIQICSGRYLRNRRRRNSLDQF